MKKPMIVEQSEGQEIYIMSVFLGVLFIYQRSV